jgi:hypothetical protein
MTRFYAERAATDEMGGYRTYFEVIAAMDSIHTLYPDITSEIFSIGQSIEGRELWVIKVSDNPDIDEDEPEVFFNGLTHAREPMGMTMCMALLDSLTSLYGIDPNITYLVDEREIWFLPVLNPDGYVYNEQTSPSGGGMWRKNRRNNGGSYGVDLNRNYGFNWGYNNIGSSGSPGSETYRGTAPFSEPETEAVRQFCNTRYFALGQNFHSYSDLMLYSWSIPDPPWGYTPDNAAFQSLSQTMYQWNGYQYGPPWEILYEVNGDASDWMYGEQVEKPKTLAWVFEIGHSFWPSPGQIYGLVAENYQPCLYMFEQAENYVPQPVSLVYAGGVIDDAIGGNGNGGLDPGESVLFTPTLRNNGWESGTGITATLSTNDPYITITSNSSAYPNLDPHTSGEALTDYAFEVSSSCPLEYTVTFRLEWTCNEPYSGTTSFDLMVGDPLYQPLGPDAYGYMAYDNFDEGGPEFNWIEVDPTMGGSGTLLPFSEDDQTFEVNLPFDFQYYGQTYNVISVCGNGWIAMGSETSTDYSNSHIPDDDGPSAMIAPFWEDLSPQQQGQVAYYYDETEHYFVVEYNGVQQYLPTSALETFELVLYDPVHYPTTTGDGQILFQYNGISDPTQNTVGIENPAETIGLELLYNNDYDPHIPDLAPGVAVLFTTMTTQPDLTVNLTYVSGSPVPVGGGNIFFDVYVENIGSTPANFDAWLDIEYEGSPPPPVLVLRSFTNYLPGWAINRPNTFFPVPGSYAAGNYMMYARLGNYPDVWFEDGFPFVKSGTDRIAGFTPTLPETPFPNPFGNEEEIAVSLQPESYEVSGVYPNPFNPIATLQYGIPEGGFVSLKVIDVLGREVAVLTDGYRNAGVHQVSWDAAGMASGIYFYILTVGEHRLGGKMVLMK